MDITTFLISVFCLLDDQLAARRLRQRGPRPTLSDSEVLTMEVIGEFLGLDADSAIFHFFRHYYADWFPALRHIDRTTFARQAANLWRVKQQLWQQVVQMIACDPQIAIVDSFPVPVCRFARSHFSRLFRDVAAYGYDDVAEQTYYGLRAHIRLAWPGVIVDCVLAPADIHDLVGAEELLAPATGWALGDRNYWSPRVRERLAEHELQLLAPFRSAKHEKQPWPRWLTATRYRIETVIGQLVERFRAKKVWARDLWHLTSRWMRKLLAHTLAVFFCQQLGLPSNHFAALAQM